MKKFKGNNNDFKYNLYINESTFLDYLNRLSNIALSMFEWVNLPKTMNARYLEQCLFFKGQAVLFYDEDYGFINTQCSSNGYINIYGLPTSFNCFSYQYQSYRNLYIGLDEVEDLPLEQKKDCILVLNNWKGYPTSASLELFAQRLYEAERTCDVNIKAQKTPVLISVDEKKRLSMENVYSQYDGNQPVIFGDNQNMTGNEIKAVNTHAPFVCNDVMEYKKNIWNEALTYLGVNNISTEKKERLITDEASQNNELINLNLQNFLAPRQEACRQFNEYFGLTGSDKEIKVRVRSDLHNIIKNAESVVNDYIDTLAEEKTKGMMNNESTETRNN